MFNWDDCPLQLFDMYMEVRGVKKSDFSTDETVFIELWVASFFHAKSSDPEEEKILRRPIYGIVKQIRKLSGGKPVCLVIMSKDGDIDPVLWGSAIALLTEQLQKEDLLKYSVLYTKSTPEQVLARCEPQAWRKESDAQLFRKLTEMLDVTVYGQANCRSESRSDRIFCKHPEMPAPLSAFLRFFSK